MKKMYIIIFILSFWLFTPVSLAHPGRTDSYGGHYDYSVGEYHYHHGYSAHQHPNGICPYEIDYDDLLPSKCPNCNSIINTKNGNYCFECGYKLIDNPVEIGGVSLSKVVDGDDTKTRAEYSYQVQSLEKRISDLETQVSAKMKTIGELNRKYDKDIEELENNRYICHVVYLSIILVFSIYIYNKGNKNKQ